MIEKPTNADESAKTIPLKKQIKHLSLEWILCSTSHGLPNIFRTDRIYLKIMWFICFTVSTAYCGFLVVSYIINFFTYSVTVSTIIVDEAPINFPSVTVCNLNPFYKNRSISYITSILNETNMMSRLNVTSLSSNAIKISNDMFTTLRNTVEADPNLNKTERYNLGFSISDILISCTFNGDNCNTDDFSYFDSYAYGNCFTFNGNSSNVKTISAAGTYNGLEMELFSGDPDNEIFVYKRGFYVLVHNQSATPVMENEGVHISTGVQTNIGIDRTFYYKLSQPYSSCLTNTTVVSDSSTELYKIILDVLKHQSYRQKYCYKLCYQKYVISNCSCYDPEYANPYPEYKACRGSQLDCQNIAKYEFQSKSINTLCADQCPQECTSVKYTMTISTATYPTDYYLNLLLLQSNLVDKFSKKSSLSTNIKATVAKVNVFYNDISYTALVESAVITWDALLGNIGGQLGLFIGISFLSIVEVVEIILEIIRTTWIYRKGKNNKIENSAIPKI